MTHSHMLRAIKRLRLTDGVPYSDLHDIAMWGLLCGSACETAQLSDLSLDRIESIYRKYFEED